MTRDTFDRFQPSERGRFGDNEHAPIRGNDSARSDLVDVMVAIHHGTPNALLVSSDGRNAAAQWLPRTKIEIEHTPRRVIGDDREGREVELAVAIVTLPRWLAKAKGLV